MPSPVGKDSTPRTPTKLRRKPQQAAPKLGEKTDVSGTDSPNLPPAPSEQTLREKAEDAPENVPDTKDVEETAEDTQGKVSQAGDNLEQTEGTVGDVKDTAEDTQGTVEGTQGTVEETQGTAEETQGTAEEMEDTVGATKDTVKDTKDTVEDTTPDTVEGTTPDTIEETKDTAEDTVEGAEGEAEEAGEEGENAEEDTKTAAGQAAEKGQSAAQGALSGARGLAGRATDLAGKATQDPAGAVQDTAQGAQKTAQDTASDVKDTTDQNVPGVPDLSILKGLEVNEEGIINDRDGNPIGRLVEGDAEDLVGYAIGDDGEILDDDGDLVGLCELLPEAAQNQLKQAQGATESANVPDISILKGLKSDKTGQILNEDGDFVGRLVEGNPYQIQGMTFDENGEIHDQDGNLLAKAELHPDVVGQDEYEEEGQEGEGGIVDEVQETAEGAVSGAEEIAGDVEAKLPGVEALEGMKVASEGDVLDEEGNVVGHVAEGDIQDIKGLTINDKGEVLDHDGNVVGKVEPTEGALDIRILEGLKVNKKGKVLDEEGEEIGELKEGDAGACAGKTINDKGEVLDKNGNVVGKVGIVSGEAAFDAMKALKERLTDVEPEVKEVEVTPDLDILEGLKVGKKGQILNEDGEPIGELTEGDIKECSGKKINEKGEVLDQDGKVIGKVRTLPRMVEQKVGEAEEAAEEAVEEGAGENLPPLSILEGLKVNKSGKLIDANGKIVGELVEGDAKKLSKSGVTCDAEGRFWDDKGHTIGRAQTVPQEEVEEEAPFSGLEGLLVVKGGYVEDENGNRVGVVVEGDPKKLVGRAVDEDGDIIDKKGSVVGHAERYEEPEEEPEPEPESVDLSFLQGRTVNKQGNVIGDEGVPIARLVEGNPKALAGKKIDDQGQIWNDSGKVIGRVELIPEEEREAKPEGPFAGLQGLRVVSDGKVADEDENIVGVIVEGNPKRLVGMAVDEDGDVLDKYGNVKGHAEPIEEEEVIPEDLSVLDGLTLNKHGYLVDANGIPIGRLVEGNLKDLVDRKSDGEGLIHNDTGKVVGRCELIPENERVTRKEGPFAGLEGLRVVKDGFVEDADGNRVGQIIEGDPKRLVGNTVDEDGDIVDKYGNVKGHAEPYEEPEEEKVDLSALAGCTVNKAGNVVDSAGNIVGRVSEGDPATMVGKKVDAQGQIWDNVGNVIGRAEIVHGVSPGPEGPFAGFDENFVAKDGTVRTPADEIIGRVIEGDIKKLVGHKVDEDGDINDKNGNVIGKAERWEPEEKERRINPMAGLRVNKEGEVRDQNGDLIGRLTAGDLGHCAGLEIDDNGYVVDNDGNKVGEVTLLENIQEEEEEEEDEETKKRKEEAELADKMANICQQTLERIQPVCKQITEYIEAADRTPRDELDEEELVNNVKPLIEEGSRILQECNGSLRGLDPDGHIAAQAKGRAQGRDATPEEYRLADLLKEITTTVVTTIDNAKRKIADMPHAKKKLNPLWALLTEPLFQIIAAVGLLLTGVLNLVGRLLNGLGLGGLINGLLSGLGMDKLLSGLGLGSLTEVLGGDKKKKKGGGTSGLPLVGGLLGSK